MLALINTMCIFISELSQGSFSALIRLMPFMALYVLVLAGFVKNITCVNQSSHYSKYNYLNWLRVIMSLLISQFPLSSRCLFYWAVFHFEKTPNNRTVSVFNSRSVF